jgi:hypothetical protein
MDHDNDDETKGDLIPPSWLKFGQRNVLFIGFVALLLPLGLALDGRRPAGTQGLGGFAFALLLCGLVSLVFFLVNAGLVVAGLARGRRVVIALIGCALPAVFGIGSMMVRHFTL